jgi:hypothetical protein
MAVETQGIAEKAKANQYKMKLVNDEYNIDFGGRLPAGAVVLVDEATAVRWYEKGVAEIAPPDEPTYAEEKRRVKRDEFMRRAKPAEGVFDQMVSIQGMNVDPAQRQVMREMPKPQRGRRRADDPLAGSPVLTDPDPDDEE